MWHGRCRPLIHASRRARSRRSGDRAAQADWQQQCYGTTETEIDEAVALWRTSPLSVGRGAPKTLVFSMLSDVQELIELGRKEPARQQLNVAKYILDKHC